MLFFSCQTNENFPPRNFYLGGIAVKEAHLDDWTNTFTRVGMNTVEVTVYAKQWRWYWDSIEEDTQPDGVLNEIRAAKASGLKVVMVLRIQLQHWFKSSEFKWHGMIMPLTDAALQSWFDKYEAYCLKWAKICETEGVDILVLGSEMNSLSSTVPLTELPILHQYYNNLKAQEDFERKALKYEAVLKDKQILKEDEALSVYLNRKIQTQYHWGQLVTFADCDDPLFLVNERRKVVKKRWIQLIKNSRKLFAGQMTYAANFDNYQEVDFWGHLDFIGINAYFPLRKVTRQPLEEAVIKKEFEKNWQTVFKNIKGFQKEKNITDKPILFTELGYTNLLDCTIESWKGDGFSIAGEGEEEKLIVWRDQPKFPQERIWAVESLHKTVQQMDVPLAGILYWKLTTHEYLLKEEPFALHFHQTSMDRLQDALVNFLK
ncbi:MAG: hypothetical protein ACJAYJ_004777 [Saprospiraceae bacterium]|jgi:hypothetical protein